jgi:hypothetical protein
MRSHTVAYAPVHDTVQLEYETIGSSDSDEDIIADRRERRMAQSSAKVGYLQALLRNVGYTWQLFAYYS